MVDTHAHIISEYYEDILAIIYESRKKGVFVIINCGDSVETSKEVVELSYKYYGSLYAAVGIHPENIDEFTEENINEIEKLIKNKYVKAIGEIGLDYHYTTVDKEKQKALFESQLKLAEKYNLPVIVHTREAIQDTYNILSKYNLKGVIHCYSGSIEMAKRFVKLGYKLGIGGTLTFKNSNLYKVVEKLKIEDIVMETDSPFLSPEPLRGTRNTPANLYYVIDKICKVKNMNFEVVVQTILKTSNDLFNLHILS